MYTYIYIMDHDVKRRVARPGAKRTHKNTSETRNEQKMERQGENSEGTAHTRK